MSMSVPTDIADLSSFPPLLDVSRSHTTLFDDGQAPMLDGDKWGSFSSLPNHTSEALVAVTKQESLTQNSQILLASVLELLCSLSEENPKHQRKVFSVISQSLIKARMLPPTLFAEELHPVRDQFRMALSYLLLKAKDLVQEGRLEADQLCTQIQKADQAGNSTFTGSPDGNRLQFSELELNKFREKPTQNFFPSRYSLEFEELSPIGKGGFGHVFKVLCKVDECQYAIKKIVFDISDSTLCMKVMREVKFLALLNHPNVVRYYGAWLEFVSSSSDKRWKRTSTRESKSSRIKIRELSDESDTNAHQRNPLRRNVSTPSISFRSHDSNHVPPATTTTRLTASTHNSGIKIRSLSTSEQTGKSMPKKTPNGKVLFTVDDGESYESSKRTESTSANGFWAKPTPQQRSRSQEDLSDQRSWWESSNSGDSRSNLGAMVPVKSSQLRKVQQILPLTRSLTLYVQMELCSLTLREYLMQRNAVTKTEAHGEDNFWCVDRVLNERIVRQLLKALAYIHSQNLIHRDVKPGNIFLRLPSHDVLLGDFGLACTDASHSDEASPAGFESTTGLDNEQESSRGELHQPTGGDLTDRPLRHHSSGVGTWTYSAPEQLHSSIYDSKVDLYSAGVIAYELYFPFRTFAEKFHNLMELRKGKISEDFQRMWPAEAGIIRQLTQSQPSLRPSAQELLRGNYFHSKDEVIQNLQSQLDVQAKEIERLTQLLREKDK